VRPRQCRTQPRFQFRKSWLCEPKPRRRCVDHLDTVWFFAGSGSLLDLSLSGETNGGLPHPGVTPDHLAASAAPPMSDFTVPLPINVHDAIDVIVALIVDYYGNVRDHYGDDRELKAEPRSVALVMATAYPPKLPWGRDLRSLSTANSQCRSGRAAAARRTEAVASPRWRQGRAALSAGH
jgi:hypothetical protein